MEFMKPSLFNTLVELENGEKLLFNSFKGSLIKLGKDACDIYQKIISPDEIDENDPLFSAAISDFKRGGFLVEDEFNEVDYIRVVDTMNRFSHSKQVSLTIAPTEDCNFDCIYCYENNKSPQYLSRENEEKIISYVKKKLEPEGLLSITWFGGEPLMAQDIICRLSEEFIKIAEEKKGLYSASIVTNGYLLNRKVAENLIKYKITMMQVTVDGAPEYHNGVRRLKNGGGTFDRILSNIRDVKDAFKELNITIRVNVGKENIDSFSRFVDKLEEYGIKNKVPVTFAEIEPREYLCQQVNDLTLTPKEFAKAYTELIELAVERRVPVSVLPCDIAHCLSTKQEGLLIGSDGRLYKCWDVVGNQSEHVGEIGNDIKTEKSLKWLAWDKFSKDMCSSCSVLPLCMGGCPRKSLVKDSIVNSMDHCSHLKYDLSDLIKILYKQRTHNRRVG